MIYRSNLTLPDMGTTFKLRADVIQMLGHDMPSDPDFEPNCGYCTHDEIAILHATLSGPQFHRKTVIDIGARFGWTAKAIYQATGGAVLAVDPILKWGTPEYTRFEANLGKTRGGILPFPVTSGEFFTARQKAARRETVGEFGRYSAFMIDGNHDVPEPLNDAKGALSIATDDCVMIFHDGRGKPVSDAVTFLLDNGFRARFYWTPNGMFVAWRGFEGWAPPDHDRDPAIDWRGVEDGMRRDIDMGRLSQC